MKGGQLESGMNGADFVVQDTSGVAYAHARKTRRSERRRAEYQLSAGGDEPFRDPITRAWARERAAKQYLTWPEYYKQSGRGFQCVCCGRWRPDHKRREPTSEVCVHCVREAGFWN